MTHYFDFNKKAAQCGGSGDASPNLGYVTCLDCLRSLAIELEAGADVVHFRRGDTDAFCGVNDVGVLDPTQVTCASCLRTLYLEAIEKPQKIWVRLSHDDLGNAVVFEDAWVTKELAEEANMATGTSFLKTLGYEVKETELRSEKSLDDVVRKAALKKLTPKEIEVLGLDRDKI